MPCLSLVDSASSVSFLPVPIALASQPLSWCWPPLSLLWMSAKPPSGCPPLSTHCHPSHWVPHRQWVGAHLCWPCLVASGFRSSVSFPTIPPSHSPGQSAELISVPGIKLQALSHLQALSGFSFTPVHTEEGHLQIHLLCFWPVPQVGPAA